MPATMRTATICAPARWSRAFGSRPLSTVRPKRGAGEGIGKDREGAKAAAKEQEMPARKRGKGYLKELGPWFDYLGRFRHALEHHVPLYVSGYAVPEETLREYGEMGERIKDAEDRGDHDGADRLTRERSALVSFFPIVEHAFGENAKKGFFQFQMMTDFDTVVEIAQRLLLEFD